MQLLRSPKGAKSRGCAGNSGSGSGPVKSQAEAEGLDKIFTDAGLNGVYGLLDVSGDE